MTKSPYLNALLAVLYIAIIVSGLGLTEHSKNEGTLLVPLFMLSLLVISASVMAVLFFYTPAKMFLDNQREEALKFFFKTLGTFAGFALLFGILLLFL
ncbi:MAG: hypothetical protein WA051_00640 [Minisyncoccia bacterium]